jgi:vanillate/3-O-methylgallate O-demethylase
MQESMSWKENCSIGDWSFLWERWFKGKDAVRLISDLSVNSTKKWEVGQSKHTIHCNRDGKIIHEGIISRLGEDEYMVFGRGTFYLNYWYEKNRENYPDLATEPDDWFNIQVAGPNAIALLEKACGESLRDVKFMFSKKITIRGKWMWALRQGMSGEPGFELQGPIRWREELIADLMELGREFDVHQLGGRCSNINHLEACFPTITTDYIPAMFGEDMIDYYEVFKSSMPAYATTVNIAGSFEGRDISDYYRSPVEFGWANRIVFDHDFIGAEALKEEKAHPKRIIRTLEWNSEDVIDVYASLFRPGEHYDYIDIPRFPRGVLYADRVVKDGKLVGLTSSYGYSYYYRKLLCLAVMDVEQAGIGNEVGIVWGAPGHRQKEIRAVVKPAPYKPDNRKSDLHSCR